jgi:hypothetical protein
MVHSIQKEHLNPDQSLFSKGDLFISPISKGGRGGFSYFVTPNTKGYQDLR